MGRYQMIHPDVILFLLQLAVMLAVAVTGGQIMRRFHQPAVLGELIGQILLGPTVLGTLAPGLSAWLFPATGPTAVA